MATITKEKCEAQDNENKLKSALEENRKELEIYNNRMTKKDSEISDYNKENRKLSEELYSWKEICEKLEKNRSAFEAKMVQLESDSKTKDSNNHDLMKEIERLRNSISDSNKHVTDLTKSNAELVLSLSNEKESNNTEKIKMKTTINQLEVEIDSEKCLSKDLKEQIIANKNDIINFTKQIDDLKSEIISVKEEKDDLFAKRGELIVAEESLKNIIAEKNTEIETLNKDRLCNDEKLAKLSEKYDELLDNEKTLSSSLEDFKQRNFELEDCKASLKNQQLLVLTDLESLQADVQQKEHDINSLQSKLQTTEITHGRIEADFQEYRSNSGRNLFFDPSVLTG